MRGIGHGLAAFALIVSLQAMTSACSSRSGAVPAQPGPAPKAHDAATTAAEPKPEVVPDECSLIPPAGEPIATVGLSDRIDPTNALHPSNASERLLFGQLYETLVRVDCMGRVQPGLASSWRLDERNGGLWIVTLRQNARFSDGTPVTAGDVRASWTRDGLGVEFRTHVSRFVKMVTVADDRTLVVQLASGEVDAPTILAHPDLGVGKPTADSPIPLGTRANRIETGIDARGIASSEVTVSRDHLPPLHFLLAREDPRDLLDAGADLLLTRDPATLDYAATLGHFQRVPLPWKRTHLFLSAGRSSLSPGLSDDARRVLATDAVRGEARGAQGPFWFNDAQCHSRRPAAGIRPHTPAPRIVYDANDRVARDLAERFVALVGAPGPAATTLLEALLPDRSRRTFQRATGLTGTELTNARREGTDAGYIVAVESRPIEPCHELDALKESAPWVAPWTSLPLVDTRLQAVVRRGRSGLTTDFDGSVLIDDVNDPRSR